MFFILENPESVTTQDILKDAMEGKEILASLAKRSMAAEVYNNVTGKSRCIL